jgi:hypothetical protein
MTHDERQRLARTDYQTLVYLDHRGKCIAAITNTPEQKKPNKKLDEETAELLGCYIQQLSRYTDFATARQAARRATAHDVEIATRAAKISVYLTSKIVHPPFSVPAQFEQDRVRRKLGLPSKKASRPRRLLHGPLEWE